MCLRDSVRCVHTLQAIVCEEGVTTRFIYEGLALCGERTCETGFVVRTEVQPPSICV